MPAARNEALLDAERTISRLRTALAQKEVHLQELHKLLTSQSTQIIHLLEQRNEGGTGSETALPSANLAQQNDRMEENVVPKSSFDEGDGVFRCSVCEWELIEGYCHPCDLEHQEPLSDDDEDEDAQDADVGPGISLVARKTSHEPSHPSCPTESLLLDSNRQLERRGTTPLPSIDVWRLANSIPPLYQERTSSEIDPIGSGVHTPPMFRELMQRGATPLMCETFMLELDPKEGIIAWADDTLFEEFSTNRMKGGDRWKIYLGRQIELDEGDPDGSGFIEDLLEETMLFPGGDVDEGGARWGTRQYEPGVWSTRPLPAEASDSAASKLGRGTSLQNEYEKTEDDDDINEGHPEVVNHFAKTFMSKEVDWHDDTSIKEDDSAAGTEATMVIDLDADKEALSSDSADSDFDSDENMSGDEDVIRGRTRSD